MTKNTSSKTKDSAQKRTFNHPDQGRQPERSQIEQPDERRGNIGQYSGRGQPPLQKR